MVAMIPTMVWASSESQGSLSVGEPRRPPREAFDACKDKSEGTKVVVTTPRGDTMNAICRSFNGELVAVPDGPPPSPRAREIGGN